MNPESSKLKQREQEQQLQKEQTHQHLGQKQFTTVEELIRFDREQINVPPSVAEKVNQSLAAEPPAPKSWWQKLIGK